MNKWEYKIIHRNRQWERPIDKMTGMENRISKGSQWWYSDENGSATDFNLKEWEVFINQLGSDGWELVGIEPSSDYLDANNEFQDTKTTTGNYAGFTSSDNWVFKRQIP